ncbi:MAG: ABC transporter permease, partial [Loktanella sp.]|nr:ABC transporter permease [Loktanella sp.]
MAKVVYNGLVPTPSLLGFTVPVTAALGGFFGLLAGQATGIGAGLGIVSGAIAGAIIAYVLATMLPYKTGRWATIGVIGIIGLLTGGAMGLVVGLCAGAILGWCAYWLHLGKYRRSLPPYATTGQVLWHNTFKFICGAILFFLIAPIVTIIPLSFNAQDFFTFTPEMLSLDPAGYSLKHYQDFFTNQDWLRPMKNSLIIAPFATIISVTLGTLAAIGLSQSHVPFRRAIMAILISPMIVPLIISATGMFFFYSQMGLWMEDTFGISKSLSGYIKVILAHAALGIPFVIITVTATLVGFDNSLTRAA